jgi:hypothetical protein
LGAFETRVQTAGTITLCRSRCASMMAARLLGSEREDGRAGVTPDQRRGAVGEDPVDGAAVDAGAVPIERPAAAAVARTRIDSGAHERILRFPVMPPPLRRPTISSYRF